MSSFMVLKSDLGISVGMKQRKNAKQCCNMCVHNNCHFIRVEMTKNIQTARLIIHQNAGFLPHESSV